MLNWHLRPITCVLWYHNTFAADSFIRNTFEARCLLCVSHARLSRARDHHYIRIIRMALSMCFARVMYVHSLSPIARFIRLCMQTVVGSTHTQANAQRDRAQCYYYRVVSWIHALGIVDTQNSLFCWVKERCCVAAQHIAVRHWFALDCAHSLSLSVLRF